MERHADWYPAGLEPTVAPTHFECAGKRFVRAGHTRESLRALGCGLRARSEALRALPIARIIESLDRTHLRLATSGLPALTAAVSEASGYPEAAVKSSLHNTLMHLHSRQLRWWLECSGIAAGALDGKMDRWNTLVYGPRLTTVVCSGNIPGAALPSIVQPLLLKSPVLVKSASVEPSLAPLYAEALAEEDPDLAAGIAVTGWNGGDEALEAGLLEETEALIAYGSDETIASLRRRLRSGTRFIGYGHRISFTVVDRASLGRETLHQVAYGLAFDAAQLDQQGCLSPHSVYIERGGESSARDLAPLIGEWLDQLRSDPPRRELDAAEASAIHQYRSAVEMRSLGDEKALWTSEDGTAWTVAIEPDPQLGPSPGNRTVVLREIDDLSELPTLLRPLAGSLISCGLCVASERRTELIRALGAAGVTRFTGLLTAQYPTDALFHDGVSPLATLARFVRAE